MYFRCADAGIVKKWQPENDEKNSIFAANRWNDGGDNCAMNHAGTANLWWKSRLGSAVALQLAEKRSLQSFVSGTTSVVPIKFFKFFSGLQAGACPVRPHGFFPQAV